MIAYVVCDDARGMFCWLALDGPFGYPKWRADLQSATPMTLSRASAYANAYGLREDGVVKARVVPAGQAVVDAGQMVERTARQQTEPAKASWGLAG